MDSSDRHATLLLVEDDEIDIVAVKRAMATLKIGNPLVVARDGIEAFEVLRGTNGREKLAKPFLIILDLKMPRMDGHEFLEELRKDPDLKDTVVFVMTTSDNGQDRLKAYEKNIAGYIVKNDPVGSFRRAVDLLDHYWHIVDLP